MRSLWFTAVFLFACSSTSSPVADGGSTSDAAGLEKLAVSGVPDLAGPVASGPVAGGRCDPNAIVTDGQDCASGCGGGTLCAGYGAASLRCYAVCDPADATSCGCGRRCTPITKPDGSSTSACLPANGAGERCSVDATGKSYGYPSCASGLTCAGSPGNRYCVYADCKTSNECPQQTTCTAVVSNMMVSSMACWYSADANGRPLGSACTLADFCVTGSLCDGTCKKMCDGPGDTSCAANETCIAMKDGAKVIGHVCK